MELRVGVLVSRHEYLKTQMEGKLKWLKFTPMFQTQNEGMVGWERTEAYIWTTGHFLGFFLLLDIVHFNMDMRESSTMLLRNARETSLFQVHFYVTNTENSDDNYLTSLRWWLTWQWLLYSNAATKKSSWIFCVCFSYSFSISLTWYIITK